MGLWIGLAVGRTMPPLALRIVAAMREAVKLVSLSKN
jgi:hypothetical protein